jgi:CxxC motif-containing protein (DUF1111 family)
MVVLAVMSGCNLGTPLAPSDAEILDGTVEGLSHEQNRKHLAGDGAFNDDVFSAENGLGPLFVATSCGSCHAGDGKGHPFTTLTRFGQSDSTGNHYLNRGGPQLQNRALPGFQPEAIPTGAPHAKFTPPSVTGLGLLEAVTEADILALADPTDTNSDGISGVPNWNTIPSYVSLLPGSTPQGIKYLCRFGKKASVYSLLQQSAVAYNQDIGVTSAFEAVDVYSGEEIDPEVSTETVQDVAFYLRTLKKPPRRNTTASDVQAGQGLFAQIGCVGCHAPTLRTGEHPVSALSNREIHPYTDLLLHDMGPGLDDGYTEGSATTAEWRTPPLWGLGLAPNSQGGQYFLLHDGRATSIEQAILLHGGEGSASQARFVQLSDADRKRLIAFLESL